MTRGKYTGRVITRMANKQPHRKMMANEKPRYPVSTNISVEGRHVVEPVAFGVSAAHPLPATIRSRWAYLPPEVLNLLVREVVRKPSGND